ncbi:MAG: thioredoxin domain-containing protein, partial [Chthoniobacterales bacterium]
MRRFIPFILIALVAACTIGAGAMLLHSKRRAIAESRAVAPADAQVALKPTHVRGGTTAPVTLEEFGDFQCPSCANTAALIHLIENEYGPKLRVIFWQLPLPNHQHGREAAIAAEAASRQGRFWEMHDLLYGNQVSWVREADVQARFEEYAAKLQLDLDRFRKDAASSEVGAAVDAQHQFGWARGIRKTPTLFVNNREVLPPFTGESLRKMIDAALAE